MFKCSTEVRPRGEKNKAINPEWHRRVVFNLLKWRLKSVELLWGEQRCCTGWKQRSNLVQNQPLTEIHTHDLWPECIHTHYEEKLRREIIFQDELCKFRIFDVFFHFPQFFQWLGKKILSQNTTYDIYPSGAFTVFNSNWGYKCL